MAEKTTSNNPTPQPKADLPLNETQPTPTKKPTSTPTITLLKTSYTIAVYGDSMVDTMGERLEYIEHKFTDKYPQTKFTLYNYGIPSQNIEHGLERFNKSFAFRDRSYPPITEIHADIIILGSFAYNPFPPHDRDRHFKGLTKLIEEAKKTGARLYLLAEIAPLRENFGKGPNGPNWALQASIEQADHIIEQLENAVALSKTYNIPLINVFYKSKANGNYGKKEYVDPNDGIHPSIAGQIFTAQTVVDTIKLD